MGAAGIGYGQTPSFCDTIRKRRTFRAQGCICQIHCIESVLLCQLGIEIF